MVVIQEATPDTSESQPEKGGFQPKTVIKMVISVALLAFLLHNTGLENTFARLRSANLWYVPVGVCIYLVSQWVSSYRWKFLSSALGFNLSLREFYDYYLIGMYFSLFLPGSIGGDVGRMVYLAKACDRKKREALLTLLAERGVGLIALLLLTAIVLLSPPLMATDLAVRPKIPGLDVVVDLRLVLLGLASCLLLGYITLWFLPLRKLSERFKLLELLVRAEVYWKDIPLLLKSIALSVLVHASMICIHQMIAHALGVQVSLVYLAAVYGIVSLVSVLPIFFNGIGAREGTYQVLLVKAGLSPETGLAFGLYWLLISTFTSLMGGLVLLKGHYKTPGPPDINVIEA